MKISIWDVLHYGSAAVLFIAGLATMLGVHLPGIEVNPTVAFSAGAGILGAGLKDSPLSGK